MGVPHHRHPCLPAPLGRANYRVIAAVLMFFMLGLQFVNAQSTSHLQFEHAHQKAASPEAAGHGHHHDEDLAPADDEPARKHTHKHDPGDHTHDLPLRLVLAGIAFAFLPDWRPAAPVTVDSKTLDPLERPPKSAAAA